MFFFIITVICCYCFCCYSCAFFCYGYLVGWMVHVVGNKKNQIKKLARGTAVPVSEMKFPTELVDLGTTSVPPSTHPDQPLDISECWKTLAVVVVAVVAV